MRTEVILTEEDGMHATCTVYFDHTSLGQRDRFGAVSRSLSADAAEFGRTLVREWAMIHQEELREDWELCRTNTVPAKIQPLA